MTFLDYVINILLYDFIYGLIISWFKPELRKSSNGENYSVVTAWGFQNLFALITTAFILITQIPIIIFYAFNSGKDLHHMNIVVLAIAMGLSFVIANIFRQRFLVVRGNLINKARNENNS